MAKIEKNAGNGHRTREGEVGGTILNENRLNEVFLSSQTRLRIAELISRRPRTLREIARLTNLSVPGVLRHIDAMNEAGLIREEGVTTKMLPVRKVYSLKGKKVMDFSVGDLSILKVVNDKAGREESAGDLESLAMQILVGRRRIKEKARRLSRAIDELVENEEMLTRGINDLGLTDEERLILLTIFTEETAEDAERVLTRIQGMEDARRSIDKALAKAKHNVGK